MAHLQQKRVGTIDSAVATKERSGQLLAAQQSPSYSYTDSRSSTIELYTPLWSMYK